MPRYAIKHTPTGKILEPDPCGENSGALFSESDYFLTWGNKQEAEDALTNMQNFKKPVYVYDQENCSETTLDISEFELVEL